MKALLLLAALLFSAPAHAMPCKIVRYYVAKYGEAAVEQYARSKGASEKQIAEHKRCLK